MARYALFICLLMLGCAARPFDPPGMVDVPRPRQIKIRHVEQLDVRDLRYAERLISLKFALDEAIAFHADEIRVLNASIEASQELKNVDAECVALTQQVGSLMLNVAALDVQAEYVAASMNIDVQRYLLTGDGSVPNDMIQTYEALREQLEEARSALIRAQLKLNRCSEPRQPQQKSPQAATQSLSLATRDLP